MRASVTNSLARSLWLPLSQPPTVPNLYRKPHPYPPTILNLALLLDSHSHSCSRSQLVSSTTSPFHSRHSALPSTSLSTPPGTHSLLASSLTSCSLAWQLALEHTLCWRVIVVHRSFWRHALDVAARRLHPGEPPRLAMDVKVLLLFVIVHLLPTGCQLICRILGHRLYLRCKPRLVI